MCGARRSNDSDVNYRARSSTHGCAARNWKAWMMASASFECGRRSPKTCWRRATVIASRRPSLRWRARHARCGSRSSQAMAARMTPTMRRLPVVADRAVRMRPPIRAATTGPRSSPKPTNRRHPLRRPRRFRVILAHQRRARRFRPLPAPAGVSASGPRSTEAAPVVVALMAPVSARMAIISAPRPRADRMVPGPTARPRLTPAKRVMGARRRRCQPQGLDGHPPMLKRSRTPP